MRWIVLFTLAIACSKAPSGEPPPTPVAKENLVIEMIEETTVGFLGKQRVPMASVVYEGKYKLPDGSEATGPACLLMLPEQTWVGVGSEVEAGGYRWRVTELKIPENDNGKVYLQRLN